MPIRTFRYFLNKVSWFVIPALLWFIVGGFVLSYYRDGAIYYFINSHYNELGDLVFPKITFLGTGIFAAISTLSLLIFKQFRNWHYFITALLCNGIPALATQLGKAVYKEPRPLNYFQEANWIHHVAGEKHLYYYSFPSGHTTSAFALFCFFTLLLPKRLKSIGFLFFAIAMLVGYSRIYLSHHFFTDIYAGSIIGTVVSLLMFWILNRKKTLPYLSNE